MTFVLDGDAHAARTARRLALGLVSACGGRVDRAAVEIVVSELVTNALEHGAPPRAFSAEWLDRPPTLRLEVDDGTCVAPVRRSPRPTEPSGRGIQLVDGLAQRWGVDIGRRTKRCWAEFDGR